VEDGYVNLKCEYCARKYRIALDKFREGRNCPKCGGQLSTVDQEAKGFELKLEGGQRGTRIPKALAEGLADKYEILEMVGRGGMGIVYKARQINLNRTVALKALLGGEGASPTMIRRFVQEAQAAGNLRHPNIVPVHDAGEIGGIHYFSMDFIEGISLDKMMGSRAMDEAKSLDLVVKIAGALQFAHENSIVHRDLKPANVIVGFKGEPHIMDFGLAKDLSRQSELSVSGTLIGTPAYMSPEAARGEIRSVDNRSDIYSLGVMLYEMLTHAQPFKGDTLYDTITRVIHAEPPPPRRFNQSLGTDLDTIVMKAIEKEPANRYQSMAEFASDIEAYLKGDPISARPVTPIERAWRKLKKHKKTTVALFLFLCMIAVIVFTLATRTSFTDEMNARLRDPDPENRLRAVDYLATCLSQGKLRSKAKRSFTEGRLAGLAEEDEDARIRLACVRALRSLKSEAMVPVIAKVALNDNDAKVQREAVNALKETGGKQACEALTELARSRAGVSIRISAIKFITEMKCKGIVRSLIAIESDPMESKYVRLAAREALEPYSNKGVLSAKYSTGLFEFRPIKAQKDRIVGIYSDHNAKLMEAMKGIDRGPRTKETEKPEKPTLKLGKLFEKLQSQDSGDRLEAVYALGILSDEAAAGRLVIALEDVDEEVSNAATDALMKMQAYPSGAQLMQLMESALPHVRGSAIRLAGAGGYDELADQILKHLEKEDSTTVACACIRAIAELKPLQAKMVIKDVMGKTTDLQIKDVCEETLAELEK